MVDRVLPNMSFTSGLVEHQSQLAQEEVVLEQGHDQRDVWNWRKKLLTWINSTHGKGTRGFLEILVTRENLSRGYNAYTSKPLVTAYLQHMVDTPKTVGCLAGMSDIYHDKFSRHPTTFSLSNTTRRHYYTTSPQPSYFLVLLAVAILLLLAGPDVLFWPPAPILNMLPPAAAGD